MALKRIIDNNFRSVTGMVLFIFNESDASSIGLYVFIYRNLSFFTFAAYQKFPVSFLFSLFLVGLLTSIAQLSQRDRATP